MGITNYQDMVGQSAVVRNDCIIIKWKAQDDIEMKMVTLSYGIPRGHMHSLLDRPYRVKLKNGKCYFFFLLHL